MLDNKFKQKFMNGDSIDAYKYLGSHVKRGGTEFNVWAPGAKSVRVVGDFNGWGFGGDAQSGVMTRDEYGFWTATVKGVKHGALYKYKINGANGKEYLKADPYGLSNELRPNTASVVYNLKDYEWTDDEWFKAKEGKNFVTGPMNIYEVHLGSWRRGNIPGLTPLESESCKADEPFLNYREIADQLADYVAEMGYTHIEVMPVAEHPLDASWGYQTLCYYSITSRYGTPDDLRYFVDKMHSKGVGVIFDWVPGHFCKDAPGLYNFDGSWVYENDNAALRENVQWGTANFDFSKGTVRSFLISNVIYYFKEYHIDGVRCDAVTNILFTDYAKKRCDAIKNKYGGFENIEGIEFCRQLNRTVYTNVFNPLMIAEESTAWPMVTRPPEIGGLGFTFKWNMGWMNDTLEYISEDPYFRKYKHNKMSFSLMYAFAENYILPISHDEVVHGKKSLLDKCFGPYEEKFDCLRSYMVYMLGHPGKKLSFMGNEFGPFMEWRHYEELEWKLLLYPRHSMLREFTKEINRTYLSQHALWENDDSYDGFEWIDADNADENTYTFVRRSKNPDDFLIFVMNFSPVERKEFHVGIPRFTDYEVVLSNDEKRFGGKGMINAGDSIKPTAVGANGKRFSLEIDLPGYGALILKPVFKKKAK